MKILAIHPFGEDACWKDLGEMQGVLAALAAEETPNIILTREWASPIATLPDFLHAVEDIALAPGTLLVANGKVSNGVAVGCVSAVSYYETGERKTAYFPKKHSAGTASEFHGEVPFEVPDGARGLWVNCPEDRTGKIPLEPGLQKYVPFGYGLSKPARLGGVSVGGSVVDGWFPICYDRSPKPAEGSVPLVVYPCNGKSVANLPRIGELLAISSDDGGFSIRIGGIAYKFSYYPDDSYEKPAGTLVQKRLDGRNWVTSSDFARLGTVETLGPEVSAATLYSNPLEAGK